MSSLFGLWWGLGCFVDSGPASGFGGVDTSETAPSVLIPGSVHVHWFSGLERPASVGPHPGDQVQGSEAKKQISSHIINKQTIPPPSSGCNPLIDPTWQVV